MEFDEVVKNRRSIRRYKDTPVPRESILKVLEGARIAARAAWVPEYGDPDDPGDAKFLAEYSPHHHIRDDVSFPSIFMYTGIHDDRVHPGHAFKFAARLDDSGHDYLLRVEELSGHAGATPKIKIDEESDIMAFVYKTLGTID